MQDTENQNSFKKVKTLLDIVFTLALLFMLGSCTVEINDIGGKINGNREAVGVFLYLLIIFPCIFAIKVFLEVKLEKLLLTQEVRTQKNEAFKKYAASSLRSDYGFISQIMRIFVKPSDNKNED